jgi:DNA repair exonuclease SbcCD nuclease subunit
MKVLSVNDIHAADRPSSSQTEAALEDLLDLLEQTVMAAHSRGVDAVVWTGDVFHSKAPSRNSHRLVQKIIAIGHAYKRPWYIVPGNHDLQHDRLASIHDTQPLGVLYRAGARLLDGQCPEFVELYGVPWQQDWTNEAVGEALREFRETWTSHRRNSLVCAHAPLYPPGHELPYEFFDAVMWASAMGNRGSCVYGHVHERHGRWVAGGVNFCNPGALSRGSLHEYNMTRPVQVAVWDSEDGTFTEVPLNAKPAEEIFRLREKEQLTDSAGKLDDFLMQVGTTQLAVLSTEAVLEHVRSMPDMDPAVADEVAELLDWAGHQ